MNNNHLQVFLAGHTSCRNRGNEAIIRVLTHEMSKRIHGIRYILGSHDVPYDKNCLADLSLDIRQNIFPRTRIGRRFRMLHRFKKYISGSWTPVVPFSEVQKCRDILESNLVIFTGGDNFCYGLRNTKYHAGRLLAASAAGIQVAVYAASFNDLKSQYELGYLKFILNEFNYVSVREPYSLDTVQSWDLRTQIEHTADPAFLLEPSSVERSKEILDSEHIKLGPNVLGINVSFLPSMDTGVCADDMFRDMAHALDRFVDKYDYHVLLIPHVGTGNSLDTSHNDRMACLFLRGLMTKTNRCSVLTGEFTSAELKGIISRCTLFCGFRTHSTIASTSTCVPTLFVAYSVKAHGIASELYDTNRWCLDVSSITEEVFFSRLSQLHCEKDALAEKLRQVVPKIRARAHKGIDSLCQLLENRKPNQRTEVQTAVCRK